MDQGEAIDAVGLCKIDDHQTAPHEQGAGSLIEWQVNLIEPNNARSLSIFPTLENRMWMVRGTRVTNRVPRSLSREVETTVQRGARPVDRSKRFYGEAFAKRRLIRLVGTAAKVRSKLRVSRADFLFEGGCAGGVGRGWLRRP